MKPTLTLLTALLLALRAVEPVGARELPLVFVKTYCVECHNDSTSEGGFRAPRMRHVRRKRRSARRSRR